MNAETMLAGFKAGDSKGSGPDYIGRTAAGLRVHLYPPLACRNAEPDCWVAYIYPAARRSCKCLRMLANPSLETLLAEINK